MGFEVEREGEREGEMQGKRQGQGRREGRRAWAGARAGARKDGEAGANQVNAFASARSYSRVCYASPHAFAASVFSCSLLTLSLPLRRAPFVALTCSHGPTVP